MQPTAYPMVPPTTGVGIIVDDPLWASSLELSWTSRWPFHDARFRCLQRNNKQRQ